MINLDLGTLIDRIVKDVFAFVANPNNMSKWNSAVVSLEQVTPGTVSVGTGTKISLNAQGNPAGFFKLAEGVMAGRVKSMMEENLARLKSALEKGA